MLSHLWYGCYHVISYRIIFTSVDDIPNPVQKTQDKDMLGWVTVPLPAIIQSIKNQSLMEYSLLDVKKGTPVGRATIILQPSIVPTTKREETRIGRDGGVLVRPHQPGTHTKTMSVQLKCHDLPKHDLFSKSDPFVALHIKSLPDSQYEYHGRTEVMVVTCCCRPCNMMHA